MSEDLVYCIRGCTTPCRDEACLILGEHNHDPILRRARVGNLCGPCLEQLRGMLGEIPDWWAQLPSIYDIGQADEGEYVSHGKATGSPALIRLDVMVLQGHGEQYDGDGVMPVRQTLGGWVQIIDEELGLKPTSDTITAWCQMMRVWVTKLAAQQWIDELYADIAAVHRALRRACRAPGPVGRCWGRIRNLPHGGCGRLLYPPADGTNVITCPNERCGRTYTGSELVKLAIQAEREGVA